MGKLCSCSWHSALMVSLRETRGHSTAGQRGPARRPAGRAGPPPWFRGGGWGDRTRDSLWPGPPLPTVSHVAAFCCVSRCRF